MESENLYRQLQQHLDRMPVGFPATESGVEIRLLKQLFTPGDAEIALELSVMPEAASVVHKRLKSKMTLEELAGALDRMARHGLVLGISIKGEPQYAKRVFAVGMYEFQVTRLTAELERDARQYLHGEFKNAFHSKKTTQFRVVPINKPIAVERGVTTYDDIRGYVESHEGPFATMTCICRHGRDLLGEKCKQTNLRDNCLTFGMAARMTLEYGMSRPISREETLALLDQADQEGLVLETENTKRPHFVCCCCGCCCGVLTSAKQFATPADYFSASSYAEVDQEKCESCGACEVRCQMDAISTVGDKPQVDRTRCIGCALCVTTCPSGALELTPNGRQKVPPDDTRNLYMQLLQERYGPWGMAKIAGKKLLGMKI